jgi:hypothetical protein
MDDIRRYSGIAGEVVQHFIRIKTFASAFPMALAWLAIAGLYYLLQDKIDPPYLFYSVLFISALLIALFTGRFAMAAKEGDFHAGFSSEQLYSGEMLNFAIRFLLFNLFWFIPALLIIIYLVKSHFILELYILLKLGISLGSGVGVWYAILVVLSFFGPLISALLASQTQTASEVISSKPWLWLLFHRAGDVPAYIGQVAGGMILFFMKYFLPLFILKLLVFKISLKGGVYFNEVLGYLPLVIFPIILGRLSGAFAHFNEESNEQSPKKDKASTAFSPDSSSTQKKDYEHLLKNIEQLSPSELQQTEEKVKQTEPDIYQSLMLSYLYKKTQQPEQATLQARHTLKQCLDESYGYEAIKLFHYYIKERTALNLSTEQLIQLADYSVLHNAYNDAAWCYIMAAVQLPEEQKLAVQKKFLHMADTARQHGSPQTANSLLTLFCKQFPDSSLSEFARQQIDPSQG